MELTWTRSVGKMMRVPLPAARLSSRLRRASSSLLLLLSKIDTSILSKAVREAEGRRIYSSQRAKAYL